MAKTEKVVVEHLFVGAGSPAYKRLHNVLSHRAKEQEIDSLSVSSQRCHGVD